MRGARILVPIRASGDGAHRIGGRARARSLRFSELARARLHLVEQPHVLDRNHGPAAIQVKRTRWGINEDETKASDFATSPLPYICV